jgi:hypothetical protein
MYHRTITIALGICYIVLAVLLFRSCKGNSSFVDRITIDTVVVSDTVVVDRTYSDTISVVLKDSVPVVYWDTVYMDTVYQYVANYSDSLVCIENQILTGGKVYETNFWYSIVVSERTITNTVTINKVESVMKYRNGLYAGGYVGYPLSVGGSIGWQFKDGLFVLAQKDFLNKETFNVCLVTPIFRR